MLDFCKDHHNSKEHKKWAEFHKSRIEHSVCPAYLLEPTPVMHCLGTNILSASLPLAQFLAQFEFCNHMADPEVIA